MVQRTIVFLCSLSMNAAVSEERHGQRGKRAGSRAAVIRMSRIRKRRGIVPFHISLYLVAYHSALRRQKMATAQ